MKDPTRYCTLLVLLILILSHQTFPQTHIPEKIQFKNFTREQGLSNGFVQTILQDGKGFLWAGTVDGLNRYDGRKFKVFKHSPGDPNSLGSNTVLGLYEDKSGILWIGTEGGGLNRYNREQENFTKFIINREDSSSVANTVMTIYEDSYGVLWIGSLTSGLYTFDRKTELFTRYKNIPEDSNSLSDNRVWPIYEDSKGNIWIGTLYGGLNRFDREEQKFTRYLYNPADPDSRSNMTILSIRGDNSGTLWLATFGGGLNKFIFKDDNHPPVVENFSYNPKNPFSPNDNCIASLYIDNNNILWLGTLQGGLNRTISSIYDNSSLSFISYKHDPIDQSTLQNNNIACIYQDNSGLLWLGTWGGGLSLLNTQKKQFRSFTHDPENPLSLSSNDVTAIYEDRSGILWIGTRDAGLNKWDRVKNEFTCYKNIPNDPNSLSNDRITDIYEDRAGILWVATYSEGLNKFDRRAEKFFTYKYDPLNPDGITDNMITSIAEDKSGVLWIGTNFNGLIRFEKESGHFKHFKYDPDKSNSLSSNVIGTLYYDNSGILWIGAGVGGLDAYDLQKDKFVNYKNDPANPNSLSANTVSTLYEDKNSTFWIGTTNGGLNKFNKENGQFRHFKMDGGLVSDAVNQILEDNHGNLWISTRNGLSKFDPETETFRNYDVEEGLQSIGLGVGCKSKTGELIFSSDGFIIFHPDSIKDNAHIPPVYITDFYLFNKPVPIGYDSLNGRTILSKSIINCEEIELNYDDKVFSFEFAALDFHAPNKNKYAYIMEGFDKDWTYVDASYRLITYTNLDPGDYVFRVKGSNNDGYWNEAGTSLKIIILPPWYQTTWAYLIYFLFIGSIIYFVWKEKLRRIKIRNEYEMSRFEAQKLHEVDELKSRFFTNISHEFRTPLTLILGPVKQIIERIKDEKTKSELSLVHKNANKLLVLVNQLLDISKLESGNMKLQTVPQNIVPLVKALTSSFTSYAERKQITLNFNSTENEIIVYVDSEKFEKIITNVLSNAFKFTPEGGRIEIIINRKDNYVIVSVSDTGVGIQKEKMSKIFDRFYQVDGSHTREQEGTGIGLSLTKELIELHKGKIEVESEAGKGSTFRISLPLGKDHLKPEEIIAESEKVEIMMNEPEQDIERKVKSKFDIELLGKDSIPLLLIVEDNYDVRFYIKDNLNKEYRVLEAVDGEDGWEKAIEQIPDLIVSDVMMPKMDGFELCTKLKTDERTSHIPVILLTAKAAKENKLAGYETGADDYIMKPFEPDELRARIKNLIQQRKRLHEHFQRKGMLELNDKKITSVDKKFLLKALEVIHINISDNSFTVEKFADNLAVSRSLLHKKVVALTGEPPRDFIRRIRLKKAAELIEKKFGNLSEIALEVGFDNPAYFSEAFKKQFGVAPSQYQRNNKTT